MKSRDEKGRFVKGIEPWNKGKPRSEKTKEKIRNSDYHKNLSGENNPMFGVHRFGKDAPMFGKHQSDYQKKNMSKVHKDIPLSEEHKQKIRYKTKEALGKPEVRKRMSEAHRGEKSHNWRGGISFEPYSPEFNNELKRNIRKRDNHTCQECGKEQKELKRRLCVHHIDYNKKNNSQLNLISLCIKCHFKTNNNRKHWTNYFKMKMFIKEFFNPQNIKVFNENKQLIGIHRI